MKAIIILALILVALPAVLAAEDQLVVAKELYASANYEEALAALAGVESSAAEVTREVDMYRAFCLYAVGRLTEAETVAESLIRREPLVVLDQAAPRIEAMFQRVRKRLLPTLIRAKYRTAKVHLDEKNPQSAVALLTDARQMLTKAQVMGAWDEELADLQVLVDGFLVLTRAVAYGAPVPKPDSPTGTAAFETVRPTDSPLPIPSSAPVPTTPVPQMSPSPAVPRPATDSTADVAPAVSEPSPRIANVPRPSVSIPVREPEPPLPPGAPPMPAVASATALSPSSVAPPSTAPPSSAANLARVVETEAIQTVLNGYRNAFSLLDAVAAKAVWPTVNSRALGRAFDQLQQQTLEFDACAIAVTDAQAEASCEGDVRYVPKVGNKSPRTEAREWRFSLRRVNGDWLIETVASR